MAVILLLQFFAASAFQPVFSLPAPASKPTFVTDRKSSSPLFASTASTDPDDLIQRQLESSQSIEASPAPFDSASDHLSHQKVVFDEQSQFFATKQDDQDVIDVLKKLADTFIQDIVESAEASFDRKMALGIVGTQGDGEQDTKSSYKILDVACGSGALWEYLLPAANEAGVSIHITGVDMSEGMVAQGTARIQKLLEEYPSPEGQQPHSIEMVRSEILEFCERSEGDYHGTIANSCYGNFFDPTAVLDALSTTQLGTDGVLCVTHPLGAIFVRELHEADQRTVPHTLPASRDDWVRTLRGLPLTPHDFESSDGYYYASARKSPVRTLPRVVRLRGRVDTGYGRGGKKLGVPTANLPASLFSTALEENVDTGVYIGWALLEGDAKGRDVPHKAVVNVGYSPTFEGKENPERIVEAHLIVEDDGGISDFYDEVMRLELIGYVRPERKFPSFPELIAQIRTDVADANDALDLEPYALFPLKDDFVKAGSSSEPWTGKSGGDETASWEFEDMSEVLDCISQSDEEDDEPELV